MRGTNRKDWFADGPLGTDNYRQQLGRSVELGTLAQAGIKSVLIYTGATQKQNKMLPGGLALRAAGDAAASLLQISCTYRAQNAAATARPLQIRGQIDWGTDGHQCTAYFDWLNGTVLQVSASSVRVIAEIVGNMGSADAEPTFDAAAIATVGATVGYGGANRPPPTFTQQLRLPVTIPPAVPTSTVTIPLYARRLWWLGPALASVQWAIGPGVGQAIGQVDPLGLITRQPYERPGPATHLQVTGNGGASTLNALVWELAL
jgi:hypothetical protein